MPRRFKAKPANIDPAATAAAAARAAQAAARVANINLEAMTGRAGIAQGSRVRIASGLYAGEFAIVESVVGGGGLAALVPPEAGSSRRARTIDLVLAPLEDASKPPADEAPPAS